MILTTHTFSSNSNTITFLYLIAFAQMQSSKEFVRPLQSRTPGKAYPAARLYILIFITFSFPLLHIRLLRSVRRRNIDNYIIIFSTIASSRGIHAPPPPPEGSPHPLHFLPRSSLPSANRRVQINISVNIKH